MANPENPLTTCEILIAVQADSSLKTESESNWWLALLEGKPPFDAAGLRLRTCEREAVSQQTQAVLKAGCHPILLFPSRRGWIKVVDALGLMRYQVGILFRGEDDAEIRYLLSHPSLEVLQARAGHGKLAYPNRAYKQALDQWLSRDDYAKDVIRKLRDREVHLEDFEAAGEAGAETEEDESSEDNGARQHFELIWSLDPHYHLRFDYQPPSTERLVQWHDKDKTLLADGIGFDGGMLWFTEDNCDLRQRPEVVQALIKWVALPLSEPSKSEVIPLKPPRTEPRRRWQIPASAAAGIVAGFILAYVLPSTGPEMSPTADNGPSLTSRGGSVDNIPKGKPHETVSGDTPQDMDKLTEQEWLETIADAVLDGEIEKAEDGLREFKQRYPEYIESGKR